MKVKVTRQPVGFIHAAEVEISIISGVRWDNISGGYNSRYGFDSLYGYIPYSEAMELVDCSGSHDFGYNSAKICIPKSLNNTSEYKEAYEYLVSIADGIKHASMISCNRPDGWGPCTKRIIMILNQHKRMTHLELKKLICERNTPDYIGYPNSTINGAIKSLIKKGIIERIVVGKAHSERDILELIE